MAPTIDILLVDDETRNLDALESILDDPAYRLLRAESADRALHLLLEHDVAAIVLDIKMPGMSGIELAGIIKNTRRFRQTPIVFLTAYLLDDQHVVAGYGAGAVDYLTKPVNPEILRHKIAVFADLFRKTRELAELNERLEARVRERTAELERSEVALRHAATQKDEFLAVLAHELRNPLAPLRTGLDLLMRRSGPDPANGRTLAAMNRQLDHMVRLIDDLLDVSRISRGLLELKKEMIDLGDVVEAAADSARPFFERRSQKLSVEAPRGICAHADPTRVAQILTNLLHNAAKFSPEGGRVEIILGEDADRTVVRVIDSGPGIAGDDVERIFEMFASLGPSRSDREGGLGIGLALARRLAEMHGGTLRASARGLPEGATFTLSLPATERPAPEVSATVGLSPTPDGADPRLKVLVIEDNADVSDVLKEWLGELGHQVSIARSGEAGIELIRQTDYHVVLCDLGLPRMNGLEVCRSARALATTRRPVMVAVTGWGREEDRQRSREAGFDHHLVKPVALETLHTLLREVPG